MTSSAEACWVHWRHLVGACLGSGWCHLTRASPARPFLTPPLETGCCELEIRRLGVCTPQSTEYELRGCDPPVRLNAYELRFRCNGVRRAPTFCGRSSPTLVSRSFHSSHCLMHKIPTCDMVSLLLEYFLFSPPYHLSVEVEPFISFSPKRKL